MKVMAPCWAYFEKFSSRASASVAASASVYISGMPSFRVTLAMYLSSRSPLELLPKSFMALTTRLNSSPGMTCMD